MTLTVGMGTRSAQGLWRRAISQRKLWTAGNQLACVDPLELKFEGARFDYPRKFLGIQNPGRRRLCLYEQPPLGDRDGRFSIFNIESAVQSRCPGIPIDRWRLVNDFWYNINPMEGQFSFPPNTWNNCQPFHAQCRRERHLGIPLDCDIFNSRYYLATTKGDGKRLQGNYAVASTISRTRKLDAIGAT